MSSHSSKRRERVSLDDENPRKKAQSNRPEGSTTSFVENGNRWFSSTKNPLTGASYSSRYEEILKKRHDLPVFSHREEFCRLIENHQILILVGQTGSGGVKITEKIEHGSNHSN